MLPTAAVGYSVFDLLDGIRLGSADFAAHGAVMFAFSTYIMESDKNQVLAVMLTLEVSKFMQYCRLLSRYSDQDHLAHLNFLSPVFDNLSEFDSSQILFA